MTTVCHIFISLYQLMEPGQNPIGKHLNIDRAFLEGLCLNWRVISMVSKTIPPTCRHHVYKKGEGGRGIELDEVGPRFEMKCKFNRLIDVRWKFCLYPGQKARLALSVLCILLGRYSTSLCRDPCPKNLKMDALFHVSVAVKHIFLFDIYV